MAMRGAVRKLGFGSRKPGQPPLVLPRVGGLFSRNDDASLETYEPELKISFRSVHACSLRLSENESIFGTFYGRHSFLANDISACPHSERTFDADEYSGWACQRSLYNGNTSNSRSPVPSSSMLQNLVLQSLHSSPLSQLHRAAATQNIRTPQSFRSALTQVHRRSICSSSPLSAAQGSRPSDAPSSSTPLVDASAAACDKAVEGLASVTERVKAAKEAVQKGKGVIRASFLVVAALFSNVWQTLLGIPAGCRAVLSMSRKDWVNKLGEWRQAAVEAIHHYWVGTKLLAADVRISSRLLLKLAKGYNLTRRERQQLTRTSADIFRLVPFAVFIIVPFMEFALPFALRLFPNMLPSTFQDKMKAEEALKRKLKARLEMAKFLQETVGEMAKEVKSSKSGDMEKKAESLQQFMKKVRTGGRVTNTEILSFAKLFNDELTLESISRPRLVSMCKYMGLQVFGTDAYLRYNLRTKLDAIKEDDLMIRNEGVESLTEAELRTACRERGMMGLVGVEEMRQQLRDWLDLSLNQAVPSSLLILSRSFLVGSKLKPEEVVSATLQSLPDAVVEQVGAVGVGAEKEEKVVTERQRKLDKLKEEEALIKEEEAQEAARRKQEEEEDKLKQDLAPTLEEDRAHADALETKAVAKAKAVSKKASSKRGDMCKLSAALATLAASSSVATERAEFLKMVNQEISLYNTMVDMDKPAEKAEARRAFRAAHEATKQAASHADDDVSGALISRVDSMLHKLEKELDAVDEKIGGNWKILDTDHDGKVTEEEVAAACAYLKDSLGTKGSKHPISELLNSLAKDQDGKILVEDIVRLGSENLSDAEEEVEEEGGKQEEEAVAARG
eukprot:TRINITY_DN23818_c0_g1_i1.p1 TRINITY_DN23818_c0_g1~~TRINITY_DN23818_c0_g1_i1.p1  ORF type:complete len:846 (+),score=171.33 TRINITY_DN23818_c0_g1_i1:88-2625(+)